MTAAEIEKWAALTGVAVLLLGLLLTGLLHWRAERKRGEAVIRRLVHALAHRHIRATKDGIGEIVLCTNRRTGRIDVHVTVNGRGCWLISDVERDEFAAMAAAESAQELADLAEVFCRWPREVKR